METEALLANTEFVRGLAASLVYGAQDVDDVVQETWLRTLSRPPRPGPGLRTWVGTVLRNVVRQGRRGEGRRTARERAVARPEGTSTEAILEREKLRRQVVDAVLDLDEPYREAIALRYLDGHRPAVIAERLGVPVSTVKTRLQRGLAKLRGRLDEEYGGDRRTWAVLLAPLAGESGSSWAATGARRLPRAAVWVVGAALVVPVLGIVLWTSLTARDEVSVPPSPKAGAAGTADRAAMVGAPGPDRPGSAPGGAEGDSQGDPADGTGPRKLVGAEVELGGRWRRGFKERGVIGEQVVEFDLSEGLLVLDDFTRVPFTRLPNGDVHLSNDAGISLTYRPSQVGDVLTLTLLDYKAPPKPPALPTDLIVVVDAEGRVFKQPPTPVEEDAVPRIEFGRPIQEIVLRMIPAPVGAASTASRLHESYANLLRAIRNSGPGGAGVSGKDLLRGGGVMLRSRAMREFKRPDVLLESHLEFFETEEDKELRHLAKYALASSPPAVRMLLERKAWRHQNLRCRRYAARTLALAESLSVPDLAEALGDPADPVVLLALCARTSHTRGSPPAYLLTDGTQVPEEVAAHWRTWLAEEWPNRSKMTPRERRQIDVEEIRALSRSTEPEDRQLSAGRLAAIRASGFGNYADLVESLRTGGPELLEELIKTLSDGIARTERWGHSYD